MDSYNPALVLCNNSPLPPLPLPLSSRGVGSWTLYPRKIGLFNHLSISESTRFETRRNYYLKVGSQIYFVSRQIATPQIIGLIPHSQIHKFWGVTVRKSKIQKFAMINPQIANHPKFLWCPVRTSQIRKFARKKAVFLTQIRNGLHLNNFFTRLRNAMLLCLKSLNYLKNQKSSLNLNKSI